MKWKKSVILLVILLMLSSVFLTGCKKDASGVEEITLESIWEKVLSIGKLDFLGGDVATKGQNFVGFMRIMIGILIFAILSAVAAAVLPEGARGTGTIVSIILAVITSIFLPGSVLAGIGAAYGTLVAFFLMGMPIVGGGYLLHIMPRDNRFWIALRIALILVLIWVLIAIKNQASRLIMGVF